MVVVVAAAWAAAWAAAAAVAVDVSGGAGDGGAVEDEEVMALAGRDGRQEGESEGCDVFS